MWVQKPSDRSPFGTAVRSLGFRAADRTIAERLTVGLRGGKDHASAGFTGFQWGSSRKALSECPSSERKPVLVNAARLLVTNPIPVTVTSRNWRLLAQLDLISEHIAPRVSPSHGTFTAQAARTSAGRVYRAVVPFRLARRMA